MYIPHGYIILAVVTGLAAITFLVLFIAENWDDNQ